MVNTYNDDGFRDSLEGVTQEELDALLAEYFWTWMKDNQLTPANVAQKTGIPNERLSEAKNGIRKMRLIWIIKAAEAFGESAEVVFRALAKRCEGGKVGASPPSSSDAVAAPTLDADKIHVVAELARQRDREKKARRAGGREQTDRRQQYKKKAH